MGFAGQSKPGWAYIAAIALIALLTFLVSQAKHDHGQHMSKSLQEQKHVANG